MSRPKIVLTGGGTAGHVMPHVALLEDFKGEGWDVCYIGSDGIEKKIIESQSIPFHTISTGKLRRYLSFQNFVDIFKVVWGMIQSVGLLWRIKPQLVFSKGGFVSVPVAIAAWLLRIPVVSHESDLTPGLANKIISPFTRRLFCSFPETLKYLDQSKSQLTGVPIRKNLLSGSRQQGAKICGFDSIDRPTLLVMGGSLGAQRLNEALAACLPQLVDQYNVVHIAGKGKLLDFKHPNYCAFEFVKDELPDIFALADLVITRAGANSIFEFLALEKPMLLIPLQIGSRGDQVHNATCFSNLGLAHVLLETELNPETLNKALDTLVIQAKDIRNKQKTSSLKEDAREKIIPVLQQFMT